MKIHLIILAAGEGRRIGFRHKALIEILGKPMLYWCLRNLTKLWKFDQIIVVANPSDIKKINQLCKEFPNVNIKVVKGSKKNRQESAYYGLQAVKAQPNDLVLFHNSANLFVKEDELKKLIKNIQGGNRAAFLGQTLHDTPKKVADKKVQVTYSKQNLVRAQTPQALIYELAKKGHEMARERNLRSEDDVSLVEELGVAIHHIECSSENFKITSNDDLLLAEKLIRANSEIVYGIGEDSHKFTASKGKKLILGTITIPNSPGLEADSDGDLILHAIYNAMSSAMSKGSIGKTATLLCKKGTTDSSKYLCSVLDEAEKKQFMVNNISISLEAARPKLESHFASIKKALANILTLPKEKIGITVTSGEGLTSFGKGEGIRCTALVSLMRIN